MRNYLLKSIEDIQQKKTLLISIVGAGGKTTTIYQLSKALKNKNSLLMTTTTAMFHPHEHVDQLFYHQLPLQAYPYQTVGFFEDYIQAKDKMIGISCKRLSQIKQDYAFDYILNEADGARRKPIKCYADYEPAIPEESDLVLILIGADALGQVLSENIAHRLNEFSRVTGLQVGQTITPDTLVKLLSSEDGFLKGIPEHAQAYVIINKVASYPLTFNPVHFAKEVFMKTDRYRAMIFAEMKDFKVLQVVEQ